MKILRIISSGYEQGGAENAVKMTNELFRKWGHEVRTISSDARQDLPHYSDVEFPEIPSSGLKKLVYSTFNIDAYKTAKQVAEEFQPDIVTLHTLHQPSASVLYALKNYRLVLCVHGPEGYTKWLMPWMLGRHDYKTRAHDLTDLSPIGKTHYAYFRYVQYPVFMARVRNIPYAIAYSNYTQRMLQEENIASIYIPEGVVPKKPKAKRKPGHVAGFAGRLEAHKGVAVMIEAMAHVIKKIPDAQLIIAGQGSYESQLRQLAKELGVEKSITFVGHLSQDGMQKFYEDIDLFLMASSPAETFGKVGVEAMSTGTPVLAPDIGGISDWLQDGKNGYFIDKDNPAAFGDKIIDLFEDPRKLTQFGQAGIQTAKAFTMENYARLHIDYFQDILRDGP
jgi:glycosyltransferase involved in cell wall biosynthesis